MTATPASLPDDALIKMALAGKAECFAILMDRHLLSVKKQIGSMVQNSTEVDDLVQEVLMKVWVNLAGFRSEASLRTWMTRIAINEVLQAYRRQAQSGRHTVADLDTIASLWETPHEHLVQQQASVRVRTAVAGLPEIYRQVLLLREFENLSMRETANLVQASISAVKSRLFRARLMLTAELRRPGVRPLAA